MNDQLRDLISTRQIYDAWRLLRAAYADAVYRFVLERTEARLVEDRCRDIWSAVYLALPRHDASGSARSWVFGVARTTLSKWSSLPVPMSLARAVVAARAPGRLVRRRDLPTIERAIAMLTDDDRELLELRYVCGLRGPELATLLERNVRSIEARLGEILLGLRIQVGARATEPTRSNADRRDPAGTGRSDAQRRR